MEGSRGEQFQNSIGFNVWTIPEDAPDLRTQQFQTMLMALVTDITETQGTSKDATGDDEFNSQIAAYEDVYNQETVPKPIEENDERYIPIKTNVDSRPFLYLRYLPLEEPAQKRTKYFNINNPEQAIDSGNLDPAFVSKLFSQYVHKYSDLKIGSAEARILLPILLKHQNEQIGHFHQHLETVEHEDFSKGDTTNNNQTDKTVDSIITGQLSTSLNTDDQKKPSQRRKRTIKTDSQ